MSNDIFPSNVREAADKLGSNWIKGEEFEGDGLVLQLSKPMEVVKSNNPQYGAQEADFLVKNEILNVGETLRFTFATKEGTERQIDTKSAPFFIGIKQVEELGVGDWVHITRTGKTNETRYTVEKIDAPVALGNPESLVTKRDDMGYPEEEIDPKSIPL